MKLSLFYKIFLIILDLAIIVTIVVNLKSYLIPMGQPVFWIGVTVEILIGYLAYRFWMRSILVQGFKRDRIVSIVLVLAGILLPFGIEWTNLDILRPAVNSDVFFFVTLITLIIYSSYVVEKYIGNTRKRESKSRFK